MQTTNAIYQHGNAIGIGAATAYSAGLQQAQSAVVQPRTVASALGRLEHLNTRLFELRSLATALSDQIGGPHPVATNNLKNGQAPEPMGAVARLNNAADVAHDTLMDVEELLKAVARALG